MWSLFSFCIYIFVESCWWYAWMRFFSLDGRFWRFPVLFFWLSVFMCYPLKIHPWIQFSTLLYTRLKVNVWMIGWRSGRYNGACLPTPTPVRSYPSANNSELLSDDSSATYVKYVGCAGPNAQEKCLLEKHMLLFTASLNTDGQVPGAGDPYYKILLPAVICVGGLDGWTILFSGCTGADHSHTNTRRGAAASWNRLMQCLQSRV